MLAAAPIDPVDMRILVADKLPQTQLDALMARGHEVTFRPELGASDLPAAVPGYDVLVVRSTRVEADTLAAGDELELVVRAGAGVNTIDTAAAAGRGIYVANVPGRNAIAVAELTMGLLLAIDRNIPDNVADLRAGRWDKSRYQKAQGVYGRRIGIVGLGAIGMAVAGRARAFGMEIHAVAKESRDAETQERLAALGVIFHPTVDKLAGAVDVLTFHVPASPSTKGMVNAQLLSHIKPGAVVINTSRGDIVDEEALLAAIEDKGLRVGVDVYQGEPATGTGEFEHPLATHPNVYGTHHIGASTEQAQAAIAAEVVRIVAAFESGEVRHAVNLDTGVRGSSTLVVRHFNKVGVLARVLRVLSEAGINVEQMDNRIFAGGEAAAATLQITGTAGPGVVGELRGLEHVIGVSVEARHEEES